LEDVSNLTEIEEIIKRILASSPQLTRKAVERLIDEERSKAGGLLTEEAAAHLVSSNLGLDGSGERLEARLRIGDLTSGLSDVSITGRVIHVFPARNFTRQDGREGKVLRMLLGDETGSVTVVFWDDKADIVSASKVKQGKLVRLLHGYTRERRGEVEINMGNRGQIFLEPLDAVEENYPPVESFFKTPFEIQGAGNVNLVGVVVDRYPASTFNRRDGSQGKVARLVLEEGGGRINVVLWDDRVNEFGDIKIGTKLRLVNVSARVRDEGGAEVHLNWASAVEVVEEGVEPEEPASQWMKLSDLRAGMVGVNVAARVTMIGGVREFMRREGNTGKVASVLLEDDSGSLRLSLWDDEVELLKRMNVGMIVSVENGYTRTGLGAVGLNIGRSGRLTINPEEVEIGVTEREHKYIEIQGLKEGQTNVSIRGRLLETPVVREVETARGLVRVASFRIEDDTGEVRVSIWRDLINEVEGLQPGVLISIENCNVRPPFDGLLQVSSGIFTKISIGE
jgi:replication factor A1